MKPLTSTWLLLLGREWQGGTTTNRCALRFARCFCTHPTTWSRGSHRRFGHFIALCRWRFNTWACSSTPAWTTRACLGMSLLLFLSVCQMQRHPSSPPSRFAALTSQPRGPQPGARLQAATLGSTAAVSSPGPLFLLGTRALSQKFLPSSDAGSFHPLFTRQHRHSTLPWQQQQQRQQQKRSHPCKVKRAPRVVIMIWTVLVHTLHVNSNSSSVQVSQRLHCPSHPQKQTCLQVWTRF